MRSVVRHPQLTRHERRALAKRENFAAWVRNDPRRLTLSPEQPWLLPVGREFAESGDLRRYILGDMTRSEANSKLLFYFSDPVFVYKSWFEHFGNPNPAILRRNELSAKLMQVLEEMREQLDNTLPRFRADLKRTLADKTLSDSEADRK
jgi:hypothetical protein